MGDNSGDECFDSDSVETADLSGQILQSLSF